jgi:hypothetical protein
MPSSSPGAPDTGADQGVPIPKTNLNPIWSLCPWPIVVSLPGVEVQIPALPAVHWLQYLMDPEGPDLDGLVYDLMPEVEEYYFTDESFDREGLTETFKEVIGTVGARHWWQVISLCSMAANSWDVLGPKMMEARADPTKVSLAAWLDVLIVTTLECLDKTKATMFTLQLQMPPKTDDGAPVELPVTDRNDFFAMAAD